MTTHLDVPGKRGAQQAERAVENNLRPYQLRVVVFVTEKSAEAIEGTVLTARAYGNQHLDMIIESVGRS